MLQAYINNIYVKFVGSLKIFSDNGTEFKNQLFEKVAKELGVKHKIYTTPYRPSSNGHIEGFHNFLKACILKHVSPPSWSGPVSYLWHVQLTTFFPTNILRNPPSFLCVEEMQFSLLILYFHPKCAILEMILMSSPLRL